MNYERGYTLKKIQTKQIWKITDGLYALKALQIKEILSSKILLFKSNVNPCFAKAPTTW
jgi:hypothetical protein